MGPEWDTQRARVGQSGPEWDTQRFSASLTRRPGSWPEHEDSDEDSDEDSKKTQTGTFWPGRDSQERLTQAQIGREGCLAATSELDALRVGRPSYPGRTL